MSSATVSAPPLIIDGRPVSTVARAEVLNPATADVLVDVPTAGAAELDTAAEAAHRAWRSWRAVPLAERQQHVRNLVETVRAHIDELTVLLTLEQGKPLDKARSEINSGLAYCEKYAGMDIPVEVIRDTETERAEVHRVPLGVVGAITAWNYPLMLALWKIGPALVAGNTVILKPSPFTPLATLRLGELAQEVLPPGVLTVLAGDDDLGRALTTHPLIAKISFTGSQRTGKAIMGASADTLKRLTLELGGNDAGIVLDDNDPAAIAEELYWGGLSNCGQVCAGLKRLYVPQQHLAQYEEALAAIAATVVVGDGQTDGVHMGPIQNRPQYDRVVGLVDAAQNAGAEVYFSGEAPEGPGYFHPVKLVRGAAEDMGLVAEEQFGPVLPIMPYRDLDEAVGRANDSELGLGASVWSNDEARATEVAGRLEAGTVWVNQHPALSPDVPFGGVKQSGIGVESSLHGLLAYTDISVLRVKRRPSGTS